MQIPPVDPTERDVFFVEVDAVIDVLLKQARSKVRSGLELPWSQRREEAVLEAQMTLTAWEKALKRLKPFRKEVLAYVAQAFRAREAVVGRRGATLWGSARGSGLLGMAIAALALSSVWTAMKTWLDLPGWGVLLGFLLTAGLLISLGVPAVLGVHRQGHLLYYADLLDAAVKLKEKEMLQATPVQARSAEPMPQF
ncbi:hypothetical protein [Deinococcus sp. UYEF24]